MNICLCLKALGTEKSLTLKNFQTLNNAPNSSLKSLAQHKVPGESGQLLPVFPCHLHPTPHSPPTCTLCGCLSLAASSATSSMYICHLHPPPHLALSCPSFKSQLECLPTKLASPFPKWIRMAFCTFRAKFTLEFPPMFSLLWGTAELSGGCFLARHDLPQVVTYHSTNPLICVFWDSKQVSYCLLKVITKTTIDTSGPQD